MAKNTFNSSGANPPADESTLTASRQAHAQLTARQGDRLPL